MKRPLTTILTFTTLLAVSPLARAAEPHAAGQKLRRIAEGQTVNLADYVVPGKTTVFDFFSKHCPDCRAIAPQVDKLPETRANVAVVVVDIDRPGATKIDWNSPVAREFNIQEIPQFKVFGPDGKLQAAGDKAYAMVTGWFR
jgi:thioredoxin